GELRFDPVLRGGFRKGQALEPDLEEARTAILAARHVVWVYPTWWGHWPALLKGFIDRVFLPGWAFAYQENSPLPKPLLAGRSTRILTTMDSPWWWYRLMHGRAGHRSMKQATLQFVGLSPVKEGTLYRCRELGEKERDAWLEKVKKMADKDAKGLLLGRKELEAASHSRV
ncbi:MAG: NAD(P)H-dependent oxidoreductase, partial [Myxococcales bacterium]|nr:NAD(P)H-dependent oxidoreductase [Myxococcales bacterium]